VVLAFAVLNGAVDVAVNESIDNQTADAVQSKAEGVRKIKTKIQKGVTIF